MSELHLKNHLFHFNQIINIMKFFIPCILLIFGCFVPRVSAQNDSLINVLEKTLQVQIDSLGAEHPDIAVYYDSLGETYMKARNYVKAGSLFNQALQIKLKKNDVDSLDIADSYHDLGICYGQQSDYAKATVFFHKTLDIRRKILGEEHLEVARSCNSLGVLYRYTGDYEEAISFHHQALGIRRKILIQAITKRHLAFIIKH